MNSEFAVSFFISIIKFVFKLTIFTVNMNSSNRTPSKKKKKLFQRKHLISGVVAMILISK